MSANRILTKDELNFISRNLKHSKRQLFWILILFSFIVGTVAIAVYVIEGAQSIVINIIFGILILLLGFIHWVFKGYNKHVLNPVVFKSSGYYKRIYEHRGKNGAYFDTINGVKVKLPWHWRRYIKRQKDNITYEYIVRDGTVAINEHPIYVISINNTLTLDYELNNGLYKTKPISLLNMMSFFLLIPVIMILSFGRNLEDASKISQVFKTPKDDTIILKNAENLNTLNSSNYIKINDAWVYQYKKTADLFGQNYILTQTERDRIYNHHSSGMNYRFFVPSEYVTKPNKKQLKESLKNNPLSKKTLFNSPDSSIVNNAIEKVYKKQLDEYNSRVKRLKRIEKELEELKPKTFILKIYDDVFNAPEESLYSIKKSLERPYTVEGFYLKSKKQLVTFQQQEVYKKDIKSAFILISISAILLITTIFSLVKIISNSRIKLRLVKEQLKLNHLKRLS